jgi:hypothetical protein
MSKINLHSIFCHLIGDDNFLSTVIELDHDKINKKKNKKNGFNLMTDMVTDYVPLMPFEKQKYSMFPPKFKSYLSPDYVRLGIKNVIEKNLSIVNISFLNSLNMLLRPELYGLGIEDHLRNLSLLEAFIVHKIHRNYQINKTKNTRKVQGVNKELIKNLSEGKITHELIQYVVNIFEINLLVFDFTKTTVNFYWAHGHKYPTLNLFKNLYCMAYVQGNYEPIMPLNGIVPKEKIQKMYVHILCNLNEIKCHVDVKLSLAALLYIDTWENNEESYLKILELHMKSITKLDECLQTYDI